MSIWFTELNLDKIHRHVEGNMVGHLGIVFTEVGPDFLRATMPVDHRTKQLMGILHGGASVVLAESIGSFGANLCVDPSRYYCVGQEINANHLRPVSGGLVTGTARPFHRGSRSHVWHIEIHDERKRLVCVSRLTMAVLERSAKQMGADNSAIEAMGTK